MKKLADNPIARWFAGAIFAIFLVVIVMWTASLTLFVMDLVLPNGGTTNWFSVALFDGGAVAWALVYALTAKGANQRGIALFMVFIDLLGVVAMVIGAIYLGGQSIVQVPPEVGKMVVNVVIAATVINVAGGYYFHLNAPHIREAIQAQSLEDDLHEQAMSMAQQDVKRQAELLALILSRRATADLKYRLRLPMTEAEKSEWDGLTIDVKAQDVPALPGQLDTEGYPVWLRPLINFLSQKAPREKTDTSSRSPSDPLSSDQTPPQSPPQS